MKTFHGNTKEYVHFKRQESHGERQRERERVKRGGKRKREQGGGKVGKVREIVQREYVVCVM